MQTRRRDFQWVCRSSKTIESKVSLSHVNQEFDEELQVNFVIEKIYGFFEIIYIVDKNMKSGLRLVIKEPPKMKNIILRNLLY